MKQKSGNLRQEDSFGGCFDGSGSCSEEGQEQIFQKPNWFIPTHPLPWREALTVCRR